MFRLFSQSGSCNRQCGGNNAARQKRDENLMLVTSVSVCLMMMLVVVLGGCASKPAAKPVAALTPDQVRKNVESFDYVWTTIRDKHFDAKLNGADWDGARAELRPKVEAATTMAEARSAIEALIAKLNQSHFGIIPAESYDKLNTPIDDASEAPASKSKSVVDDSRGRLGMVIRANPTTVNNKTTYSALVIGVKPGSAAAAAGIKPGFTIERFGKVAIADRLNAAAAGLEGKLTQRMQLSMVAAAINSGNVGRTVNFTVRDLNGKAKKLKLTYTRDETPIATFGNLPPIPIETESSTLPSGIGYAHFSIWLDPPRVSKWFDQFMKTHSSSPGVIIDLRGNPGGLGAMAMGMGGYFNVPKNTELGTQITRETKLRFVVNPRFNAYTGKLAILTDELSMSTSEIFAGGMKDIGRARIFGTSTPGVALPSSIERLANGDGFQYAFANYISAGGKPLEGVGVLVDEPVQYDAAGFKASPDPVVAAAEKWILSGK